MKVKVNIINTAGCILMSEAVTMSNLMMTLVVSEESFESNRHTVISVTVTVSVSVTVSASVR